MGMVTVRALFWSNKPNPAMTHNTYNKPLRKREKARFRRSLAVCFSCLGHAWQLPSLSFRSPYLFAARRAEPAGVGGACLEGGNKRDRAKN